MIILAQIIVLFSFYYYLFCYTEKIDIVREEDTYVDRKHIFRVIIPCLEWAVIPTLVSYVIRKFELIDTESLFINPEVSILLLVIYAVVAVYEFFRWVSNKYRMWRMIVKSSLYVFTIVYIQNQLYETFYGIDIFMVACAIGNAFLAYVIYSDTKYVEVGKSKDVCASILCDTPIIKYTELYSVRKKEVVNLHDKLSGQSDSEPFAVMVKGKWGSGKTSLMNGFKDEYSSEYDFIDVNVGYTCDIGSILGNMDKSFQNIFEEQLFFYKDSNKSIWNYFKLLKELTNGISEKSLDRIIETISNRESFTEAKNSINTLLDEYGRLTGKKIIIVIDDLERCPSQNLKNVFAVLIESFKLNNCITVLLCDYEQLKNRVDGGKEYLDKYINRSITLQMVEQSEQVKKLLENIDIPRKIKFIEDLIEIDKELGILKENDIHTEDFDNNQYKTFLNEENYTRLYRLPRTMVRIINLISDKLVLLRYNNFIIYFRHNLFNKGYESNSLYPLILKICYIFFKYVISE